MRVLVIDIQGGDGTANLAIAEAADRLEALHTALHDAINLPKGVVPDSADGLVEVVAKDKPCR